MLPRPTPKGKNYLTAGEVELLSLTQPLAPRYTALVLLGAYGGLRWGELAGLRLDALRLVKRKVEVVETDQGTEPKWGSAGTVTIPTSVADELALHIDTFGVGSDGHVFTSPEGRPLAYSNFYRRAWVPAVRAADLEPFTPHGLRHTAVALAIAAGAHPKQIQELCRHRSITTTLNEYGGLFESLHDELADRLDEARKASAAGRMRDQDGTNVIALPAAVGEQGH